MPIKTDEIRLCKTIAEFKFKPRLESIPSITTTAAQLKGYPDWETDGLTVELRNFSEYCHLTLSANRVAYEQDSSDTKEEAARIGAIFETVPESINIESYTRLGYRRKYFVPVQTEFDELVQLLNLRFLSQHLKLRSALHGMTTDIMFRVDLSDAPYSMHLTLGPAKKEQLKALVGLNAANLKPTTRTQRLRELHDAYPDVALFVDLDYYHSASAIGVDSGAPFVERARAWTQKVVRDLVSYALADRLEG